MKVHFNPGNNDKSEIQCSVWFAIPITAYAERSTLELLQDRNRFERETNVI